MISRNNQNNNNPNNSVSIIVSEQISWWAWPISIAGNIYNAISSMYSHEKYNRKNIYNVSRYNNGIGTAKSAPIIEQYLQAETLEENAATTLDIKIDNEDIHLEELSEYAKLDDSAICTGSSSEGEESSDVLEESTEINLEGIGSRKILLEKRLDDKGKSSFSEKTLKKSQPPTQYVKIGNEEINLKDNTTDIGNSSSGDKENTLNSPNGILQKQVSSDGDRKAGNYNFSLHTYQQNTIESNIQNNSNSNFDNELLNACGKKNKQSTTNNYRTGLFGSIYNSLSFAGSVTYSFFHSILPIDSTQTNGIENNSTPTTIPLIETPLLKNNMFTTFNPLSGVNQATQEAVSTLKTLTQQIEREIDHVGNMVEQISGTPTCILKLIKTLEEIKKSYGIKNLVDNTDMRPTQEKNKEFIEQLTQLGEELDNLVNSQLYNDSVLNVYLDKYKQKSHDTLEEEEKNFVSRLKDIKSINDTQLSNYDRQRIFDNIFHADLAEINLQTKRLINALEGDNRDEIKGNLLLLLQGNKSVHYFYHIYFASIQKFKNNLGETIGVFNTIVNDLKCTQFKEVFSEVQKIAANVNQTNLVNKINNAALVAINTTQHLPSLINDAQLTLRSLRPDNQKIGFGLFLISANVLSIIAAFMFKKVIHTDSCLLPREEVLSWVVLSILALSLLSYFITLNRAPNKKDDAGLAENLCNYLGIACIVSATVSIAAAIVLYSLRFFCAQPQNIVNFANNETLAVFISVGLSICAVLAFVILEYGQTLQERFFGSPKNTNNNIIPAVQTDSDNNIPGAAISQTTVALGTSAEKEQQNI